MFAAGNNYYSLLEQYGNAIRLLHHARVSPDNLLGWWSYTAYYGESNEGNTWTNAQWLAEHFESLGYDYFHLDGGYQYSCGEYVTPDASKFPHGLMPLTLKVSSLGLKMGFWTAPFEVCDGSWVYQHHQDWLYASQGEPIPVHDNTFVLDVLIQPLRPISGKLIRPS